MCQGKNAILLAPPFTCLQIGYLRQIKDIFIDVKTRKLYDKLTKKVLLGKGKLIEKHLFPE